MLNGLSGSYIITVLFSTIAAALSFLELPKDLSFLMSEFCAGTV
jgi:hypothetical protein